jgi:hypothetical protein
MHALVAFATAGALHTAQDLAGRVMQGVPGADVGLVAEETLALVAVATARAAEVGLGGEDAGVSAALQEVPLLYRDYFAAAAALEDPDAAHALADAAARDRARLGRKLDFYRAHLPEGAFPGERALNDKLPLWVGRVSGPGLGVNPDAFAAQIEAASVLALHLRLVLAYARRIRGEAAG